MTEALGMRWKQAQTAREEAEAPSEHRIDNSCLLPATSMEAGQVLPQSNTPKPPLSSATLLYCYIISLWGRTGAR